MAEMFMFTGVTKLDIPVDRVLNEAADAGISVVLVLGHMEDGSLYAAASTSNTATVILLCEEFKHKLLSGEFG